MDTWYYNRLSQAAFSLSVFHRSIKHWLVCEDMKVRRRGKRDEWCSECFCKYRSIRGKGEEGRGAFLSLSDNPSMIIWLYYALLLLTTIETFQRCALDRGAFIFYSGETVVSCCSSETFVLFLLLVSLFSWFPPLCLHLTTNRNQSVTHSWMTVNFQQVQG